MAIHGWKHSHRACYGRSRRGAGMFGIGISELLLIGVVALLFVPADKLPHLLRDIAHFISKLRKIGDDVRHSVLHAEDEKDLRAMILETKPEGNLSRTQSSEEKEPRG